jgi:hypothetical protein
MRAAGDGQVAQFRESRPQFHTERAGEKSCEKVFYIGSREIEVDSDGQELDFSAGSPSPSARSGSPDLLPVPGTLPPGLARRRPHSSRVSFRRSVSRQ